MKKTIFEKLNQLNQRSMEFKKKPIDRNLYKLLSDVDMLQHAYENIKSRPGNLTPGVLDETLDGISKKTLEELSKKLVDESFQFRTARRTFIPKKSGQMRPITISPPRDKIVQESMRIILNAIYEPLFMEQSHGFRPGRGCHSALKQVNQKFQSTVWLIEGDIEKCFDKIDHTKLMNLIEGKILDRKFTRLIWKSLRANLMETKIIKHNIIGTFQGSIISPILANIFLHQLDEAVYKIKENFENTKTDSSRINPNYNKLRYPVRKLREANLQEEANKIAKQRLKTPFSLFSDPTYKKMEYIRYADDWIIGIKGTKQEAEEIKIQVKEILTGIGLTLNETKTKITNINKSKALFLGTNITRAKHRKFTRIKLKSALKRNPLRLRFEAPMKRIKSKLTDAGFLKNGKSYPRFIWMNMIHMNILNRYNAVLRGYANYYSFVHNYGRMIATIEYWLRSSCAKLLAAKFSLGTIAQVLKKFGKELKTKEGYIFEKPSYKITGKFQTKFNPNGVISALYSYKADMGSSSEGKEINKSTCTLCGSDFRIEMHHIRALRDLKPNKSPVDKLMSKVKRKQIALCRTCHLKKHKGMV